MSTSLFKDINTLLEFYQAMGLEGIPVTLKEPAKVLPESGVAPGSKKTETARPAKINEGTSPADKERLLGELRQELGDCTRCKLSGKRTHIVFGEGNPNARLMFIGEGPGKEEDIQGRPFVGEAGMLLTSLIDKKFEEMKINRSDVYIANIVKCRPPMNREPEEDEIVSCRSFIERQIDIIRPEVIVTLGNVALQTLFSNTKLRITAARGKFLEYKGIPVMPTFHPAYLLRNRGDKWKTWDDMQKVLERLNQE